jgi:hypothetical protein
VLHLLVILSLDQRAYLCIWLSVNGRLRGDHLFVWMGEAPRVSRGRGNELIHDFFEEELVSNSLMLIPNADGRLPTKHHKKMIPSHPFSSPPHPNTLDVGSQQWAYRNGCTIIGHSRLCIAHDINSTHTRGMLCADVDVQNDSVLIHHICSHSNLFKSQA